MDCSPPGNVVHGILQARILEWVAISYAKGSSQPRNRTLFFFIAGRLFTSYKGRPLQSTEQHLQLLPLDVSRSPIPCPHPQSAYGRTFFLIRVGIKGETLTAHFHDDVQNLAFLGVREEILPGDGIGSPVALPGE